MTQISFNVPKIWDAKRSVAPPHEFSLDIKDESPPDSEFDFDSFFNGKHGEITSGDCINCGRKSSENKNFFHPSQSLFARDKRNANRARESNTVESDLKVFNLINSSDMPSSDLKSTDFTFTSQQDNDSHLMKFKDSSECEVEKDFSDLLSSISTEEQGTPVFNVKLGDIRVPEFSNLDECYTKSSAAQEKNASVSNYNLSDILSSICIENCDESSPKRLNHFPVQSSDESLCLGDFNVVEDKCIGHIYGLDSELSIRKEDAEDFIISKDLSLSCGDAEHDETSLASLAKSHFLSSGPSENLLTVEQDEISINCTQQGNSHSDREDSISMLDLFNSLKSSEEGSKSKILSDEIEKEEIFTSQGFNMDDEEDQIMAAVDLRTCIKSFEDKSCCNPSLPPKDESVDILEETKLLSPLRNIFNNSHSILLPFGNSSILQASRGNLKQSLFAKALSCKPKKDPILLLKAADIKSKLFNKVFNRPVLVINDSNIPLISSATYSDRCVVEFSGRRTFGRSGD